MDNIDILEVLVQVWQEDVMSTFSAAQKRSIALPIAKAKEIIHKIYPVLFADEFQLHESNYMESACFDEQLHQLRRDSVPALERSRAGSGVIWSQLWRDPAPNAYIVINVLLANS